MLSVKSVLINWSFHTGTIRVGADNSTLIVVQMIYYQALLH